MLTVVDAVVVVGVVGVVPVVGVVGVEGEDAVVGFGVGALVASARVPSSSRPTTGRRKAATRVVDIFIILALAGLSVL